MDDKYIIVSNYEKADVDDFYLSDEWLGKEQDLTQEEAQKIRNEAKEGRLYEAYIVKALDFAIYWQMDAQKVIIGSDLDDVRVWCESSVIGTDFTYKQEYTF